MSKKNSKKHTGIKYELLGVFFLTVAGISFISLIGFNVGLLGNVFAKFLQYMFGIGSFFIPFLISMIGLRYILNKKEIIYSKKFFGILLFYIAILTIYHHFIVSPGNEIMPEYLRSGGGLVSGFVLFILRKFFGVDGTLIILIAVILGAILISTTWSLARGLLLTQRHAVEGMSAAKETIAATYEKVREKEIFHKNFDEEREFYNQEKDKRFERLAAATIESAENKIEEIDVISLGMSLKSESAGEMSEEKVDVQHLQKSLANEAVSSTINGDVDVYKLPEISKILAKVAKTKNAKATQEIVDKAKVLEETLESFHVKAKIINACKGPAVTRYELEPAAGVKVSKIVNLADDIALKLAAPGIRIEAPIPGKAAIGIEVPNSELAGVQLREVLERDEFLGSKAKLAVGLGMDIGGKAIIADLAKMPHLLVAGATGSGKSVCINTLITSVLFKAKPDEVKFILIDPKMVELSNYNGIPHLMVPVVTDARKAAAVLNWAVQEMEKRYASFAAHGVRDMERYNHNAEVEKMPAIVIIIDELADLMMVASNDVEDAICRLAQKARAAGIHLILATQRPSVDVITGIIKANIPSRISFAVSSQIDSRTILDMSGAENLLGRGDMLYYPVGASKPLRIQGAFISDNDVERLIEFIKKQGEPVENEEIITFTENAAKEVEKEDEKREFEDELLERAVEMVLETGQASVSMLQRRFRIGYTRAGRLIDTMEEMRIVGPNLGSKAREILMTSEQVHNIYFK